MLPGTHQQLMIVEQNPLRQRLPTNLVFTICQEMCGSCAMIGTVAIALPLRQILQGHLRALAAWAVVAAGTAAPGAAVCRTGAATRLTAGATTLACALSCSFYPKGIRFLTRLCSKGGSIKRAWPSIGATVSASRGSSTTLTGGRNMPLPCIRICFFVP